MYLTSCSALSSDHLPVLTNAACRSSFHHPMDSPDFRRTYWANFQTHLEDKITFDPELHEMAIDTCIENSGTVLKALAASTPKSRPRDDPWPPIPAGIEDEIRLKNRLRKRWQITIDPALSRGQAPLEVGEPPTQRVEKRPVECALESLDLEDQLLWKMTMMRVPTPSPSGHPGGNRSLRLRKPKPLLTVWRLSFSR